MDVFEEGPHASGYGAHRPLALVLLNELCLTPRKPCSLARPQLIGLAELILVEHVALGKL